LTVTKPMVTKQNVNYMNSKNTSRLWISVFGIFILLLYLLLALIHLYFPYYADQALFNLAAEMMNNHAILYKDFWDIKQPGIFYFFYLGGKIFSFSEEGIHSFEILYWFLFSIAIMIYFWKSNFLNNDFSYFLLPVLTVGSYYILADSRDLTQVEILVSLPLALSIFIMDYFLKSTKIAPYLLLGLLISIVLFYKLLFLLIIGGFILFHLIEIIKIHEFKFRKIVLIKILPGLIGFSILPVLFLIYIYHNDISTEVIYTYFILPPKIITELPTIKSFSVFLKNGFEFVKEALPLVILAIPGLFLHSKAQRPLVFQLLLWLFLGTVVIGMQRTSYWPYQFQLLIFPLGILSLIGIDKLIEKFSSARTILIYFFLVIFIPFAKIILKKTYSFYLYNPINIENRMEYKNLYQYNYLQIKNDIKFLEKENNKSEIYICGDPLYYYLSKKSQPISLNGWCLEFYPDNQYIDLVKELKSKTPEFIFISSEYYDLINGRAIVLKSFIDDNYTNYKGSLQGIWLISKNVNNHSN